MVKGHESSSMVNWVKVKGQMQWVQISWRLMILADIKIKLLKFPEMASLYIWDIENTSGQQMFCNLKINWLHKGLFW